MKNPDTADVLAAGRPFPVRNVHTTPEHVAVRDFLQDCRQWWLDAAEGYARTAAAALRNGDVHASVESLRDSRDALDASRRFAPKAVA